MSNSNRGFFSKLELGALALVVVIAIGIGIFTWPSTPSLTRYGEANPRNSSYSPGGSECQPATLAAISDRRKRIRQADACAKEAEDYRQQTNDLIQQTRAADAAQAQADIASQQLWAGFFQTIAGFLTLCAAVAAARYAKRAADETKRSAIAAEEQVRLHAKTALNVKVVCTEIISPQYPEFWLGSIQELRNVVIYLQLEVSNIGPNYAFVSGYAGHIIDGLQPEWWCNENGLMVPLKPEAKAIFGARRISAVLQITPALRDQWLQNPPPFKGRIFYSTTDGVEYQYDFEAAAPALYELAGEWRTVGGPAANTQRVFIDPPPRKPASFYFRFRHWLHWWLYRRRKKIPIRWHEIPYNYFGVARPRRNTTNDDTRHHEGD